MNLSAIQFSGRAVRRIFERGIQSSDVLAVIRGGEIIESYPDDEPYPSFLILGRSGATILHVVLGVEPNSNKGLIITVYVPEPDFWSDDFRTRRHQ